MRELPLTQGKVALVDDKNYERVSQYKWSAANQNGKWYACRHIRRGGYSTTQFLHRFIMNAPDNMEVDHINNDGLDCREVNMRLCTKAQNLMNKSGRTDGYKGVIRPKAANRGWAAQISVNNHSYHLGTFKTEKEAAEAYDDAARKFYGEFARTNF